MRSVACYFGLLFVKIKKVRQDLIKKYEKSNLERLSALVTAAFGLIAALAWNGTIQAIFREVFGTAEGIVPMLVYAIVVTIIAVVVTVWIGKILGKEK